MWDILVIIYPEAQVQYGNTTGYAGWSAPEAEFTSQLTSDDVTYAEKVARDFPVLVNEWSGGKAAVDVTITVADTPLDSASPFWMEDCYWPNIYDTSEHWINSDYDSIFVLWPGIELQCVWGLGAYVPSISKGYTAIAVSSNEHWDDADGYVDCQPEAEIFVHEWLHHALSLYEDKGVKDIADIDKELGYGYAPGTCSRQPKYEAVLKGHEIPDGSRGIPKWAWETWSPTKTR